MFLAAAVGGLVFAVYVLGACPTIYVGDSGELVAAVHLLGIPHPTGYPLYVLLGKLWTLVLPLGTVAWRMSVLSAASAAAACALLCLCLRARLDPAAAAFSALLLAFSPSFWSQANIQRVYALGALFVLLATAAAWRWYEDRSGRRLAAAFFLCGLGATNHTFMAVYAVALTCWVVVVDPSLLLRLRNLMAAGASFALGLLPYAYLPIRSRANPRLDWGNPETVSAFLDVVLRRDFWERAWIESPADLIDIAGDYGRSLRIELGWGGVGLVLLGFVAGWRSRRWPVLLPVLVMFGNLVTVALHGSRSDIFIWHRYYIPSYAMMAVLAGLGCHVLIRRMPRALKLLPLGIPMAMLLAGWHANDRSRYRIAESFGMSVFRSLPPGAHLIATDDNILFSLLYLHLVERLRPDVNLIPQGVGDADLPPLRFNPDNEPVFFTHHPNWSLPSLELVPVGLLFRACRAGEPPPEPILPEPLEGERDPRVPKDYLTQNLIGQFHYMLGFTFEQRDWPRARREFEEAAAAAPHNDVLFYNLGLIFRRNGLVDDALRAFERSHAINPRYLASHTRARASDRVRELVAERERLLRLERRLVESPAIRDIEPGTPAYHRSMAELLEEQGETLAARGHRLRALEQASPINNDPR